MPQEQIDALLVEHARAGQRVVRLKGGDPFVFGRGGEEALALRARGRRRSRSCPGVTAGVAAPAYAGHPGDAPRAAPARSRRDRPRGPGKDERADRLGRAGRVPRHARVLHGRRAAWRRSPRALIAAGRDAAEPAAVVAAGHAARRSARCARRSRRSAERARASRRRARRRSPSSGPSPALPEQLAWLEREPLVRAHASRSRVPARRRARWPRACARLGAAVVRGAGDRGPDALPGAAAADPARLRPGLRDERERRRRRCSRGSRPAAATRARWPARGSPRSARARRGALAAHGIAADVVPERFVAESLVEALAGRAGAARALVARARRRATCCRTRCAQRGAEVDVLALYETVAEPLTAALLRGARGRLRHVHVGFDRAQLPRRGGEGDGDALSGRRGVVSIGPVTTEALREHGLEADVEAPSTTSTACSRPCWPMPPHGERTGAGRAARRPARARLGPAAPAPAPYRLDERARARARARRRAARTLVTASEQTPGAGARAAAGRRPPAARC